MVATVVLMTILLALEMINDSDGGVLCHDGNCQNIDEFGWGLCFDCFDQSHLSDDRSHHEISLQLFHLCYVESLSSRLVSSRLVSSRLVSSRLVSSRLVSSRLVSSRLVSSRLVSSRLVSSRLVSSRLVSPRLASPRLASPRLASPRLASPRLASPRLASPRLASPRLASPRLASPRLASPRLASPLPLFLLCQHQITRRHFQKSRDSVWPRYIVFYTNSPVIRFAVSETFGEWIAGDLQLRYLSNNTSISLFISNVNNYTKRTNQL